MRCSTKLESNDTSSSSTSSSNRNENSGDTLPRLRWLAADCPRQVLLGLQDALMVGTASTSAVLLTLRLKHVQTLGYQTLPPDELAGTSSSMPSQQMQGPHQDLMQTESENRLLRHRLNTHRDQATGIESSLAEVAQLTEMFTQQVMQQSEQIEILYTEVRVALAKLVPHSIVVVQTLLMAFATWSVLRDLLFC